MASARTWVTILGSSARGRVTRSLPCCEATELEVARASLKSECSQLQGRQLLSTSLGGSAQVADVDPGLREGPGRLEAHPFILPCTLRRLVTATQNVLDHGGGGNTGAGAESDLSEVTGLRPGCRVTTVCTLLGRQAPGLHLPDHPPGGGAYLYLLCTGRCSLFLLLLLSLPEDLLPLIQDRGILESFSFLPHFPTAGSIYQSRPQGVLHLEVVSPTRLLAGWAGCSWATCAMAGSTRSTWALGLLPTRTVLGQEVSPLNLSEFPSGNTICQGQNPLPGDPPWSPYFQGSSPG